MAQKHTPKSCETIPLKSGEISKKKDLHLSGTRKCQWASYHTPLVPYKRKSGRLFAWKYESFSCCGVLNSHRKRILIQKNKFKSI
jgi:hypothetical protein